MRQAYGFSHRAGRRNESVAPAALFPGYKPGVTRAIVLHIIPVGER
jgi:hypothetical protein